MVVYILLHFQCFWRCHNVLFRNFNVLNLDRDRKWWRQHDDLSMQMANTWLKIICDDIYSYFILYFSFCITNNIEFVCVCVYVCWMLLDSSIANSSIGYICYSAQLKSKTLEWNQIEKPDRFHFGFLQFCNNANIAITWKCFCLSTTLVYT